MIIANKSIDEVVNFMDRLIKHKKWKDYCKLESECIIALILTFVVLVVFFALNIHGEFKSFYVAFQNITLYIASALIGMMGVILAGIAIITGVLNKKVVKKIDEINGSETVEKLLTSFEFLGFNTGVQIILFFLLYIILNSPRPLVNIGIFYFLVFIICYLFLFIIFYTVSLIGNCIRIFFLRNDYEDIIESERNFYELANEIRIDYLLEKIIKKSDKDMVKDLNIFVDKFEIENKEEIKEYFIEYYTQDK